MKYPKMLEISTRKDIYDTFRGYNHNLKVGRGEWYDMQNITADYYPVISTRSARLDGAQVCRGMIDKGGLMWLDDNKILHYTQKRPTGPVQVITNLSEKITDGFQRMINMGKYIYFPDSEYVHGLEDGRNGYTRIGYVATNPTIRPCRRDGTNITPSYSQKSPPENPENMAYWLDTSTTPGTIRQYNATTRMWTVPATSFIKIPKAGEKMGEFIAGDCVHITGSFLDNDEELKRIGNDVVIANVVDDGYVIYGLLSTVKTSMAGSITYSRRIPLMDFVIESGNRLWGCRYGKNLDGEMVNEIYASKLGDPLNWYVFQGISTDSYMASVGSDGAFTGAAEFNGHPIFFKEKCMHKVYGTQPSNFQVQKVDCKGVQAGCDRSIATIDGILYYKSPTGVCVYDGSLPREISECFGETRYDNASAGAHKNKYYISMREVGAKSPAGNNTSSSTQGSGDGLYHLFVYDTRKGIWTREDNLRVDAFQSDGESLHFINHEGSFLGEMDSSREIVSADPVEWYLESGIMGIDGASGNTIQSLSGKKYYSQVLIRMSLDAGSRASVYIQYDSDGQWQKAADVDTPNLRTFNIPIRPHRCDHFRIKISGTGAAKIYSVVGTIEQGSDR